MSTRAVILVALMLALSWRPPASGADDQREAGRKAIQSLTGCYLVDYSFVETESLRPGYVRDPRVYDVNRDKSVKEWISAEPLSDRRIRLQRILFATDLRGAVRAGQRDPPSVGGLGVRRAVPVRVRRPAARGRRRTCAPPPASGRGASRISTTGCAISARRAGRPTPPIPSGRARTTRRSPAGRRATWRARTITRSTAAPASSRTAGAGSSARRTSRPSTPTGAARRWSGRRARTGTCGCPTPSAPPRRRSREPRQAFWALLRETWDGVLTGGGPFVEATPPGQPPRFMKMYEVEGDYVGRDLTDPVVRKAARERVMQIIEEYRVPGRQH